MGLRVVGWSFLGLRVAGWSFFRDSWSGGFLGILGLEEKMPSLTPHPECENHYH
ncbi:hypothetical protein CK203_025598 [Vitis vinifera]|uniref:Uncharacterized protein n=1 Tax=Vitis vinifera TaxID=29760 RepID=A0A438IEK1_VITVI|nr:hypothetical protein CK203_025598 [Vitis vinifera]